MWDHSDLYLDVHVTIEYISSHVWVFVFFLGMFTVLQLAIITKCIFILGQCQLPCPNVQNSEKIRNIVIFILNVEGFYVVSRRT